MFHMIRRQMMRRYRKPLIVLTPKSLLRHKMSVSPISDLLDGRFQVIIPETESIKSRDVTRVVFCSGKVYFELVESRALNMRENVAIVRIEQLYPFPDDEYEAVIKQYPNARKIVWCQEEPENQGAWYQIRHRLQKFLGDDHVLYYAGRPGAAAPASGIFKLHLQQQQALVEAALDVSMKPNKSPQSPESISENK